MQQNTDDAHKRCVYMCVTSEANPEMDRGVRPELACGQRFAICASYP